MELLYTQNPLLNMLVLSALLFGCGIYTIITRKNAVAILMGVELVLNSANLNLVAFNQLSVSTAGKPVVDGVVFTLFVIVLAAAEAAVALAIIIGIYRNLGTVDVDNAQSMKW